MHFVLVFGSYPAETNLLFDNDAGLKAEQTMQREYARAYSESAWDTANQSSDLSTMSRYVQKTTATCIPHR
jgi:hypothetical protein